MRRGWQGGPRLGCIHVLDARSRDQAFPICHPQVNLTCSLPWSKCPAASEIVNVAQVRLDPMFSRKMLGSATMSTKRRWISFSWPPIGAPVLAADDGELGMGKLFEAWPTWTTAFPDHRGASRVVLGGSGYQCAPFLVRLAGSPGSWNCGAGHGMPTLWRPNQPDMSVGLGASASV